MFTHNAIIIEYIETHGEPEHLTDLSPRDFLSIVYEMKRVLGGYREPLTSNELKSKLKEDV